jgi:hypothetical protein
MANTPERPVNDLGATQIAGAAIVERIEAGMAWLTISGETRPLHALALRS